MPAIVAFYNSNSCILCQQYLHFMPAVFVLCKILNVEDSCSDDTGSLIETARPAMRYVWKKFAMWKSAIIHNKQMHKPINRCTMHKPQ